MADWKVSEELVRDGAIALNGGHERYAVDRWGREARCVLEGALAGRAVVDNDSGLRLPFDARDRIERALRVQGVASGSVEGAADRIMRALTEEVSRG